MGNIGRVFIRDLKRLAKAPAAWSVVLFLVVLPSLYTWFNVAAFWNPYDNTGNLHVCVVNEDAGVKDDMLGELHLGDQVVDQLSSDDRLGWEFVSREEAMDAVNSGRAYAAFIIPEDFSANVATFTTGDFVQPQLLYYVNEKVGPVAPKVTDTGANTLDTTINDAFFSSVSSTVAAMLNERIGDTTLQVEAARSSASAHVQKAIDNVNEARASLAGLEEAAADASGKADNAKALLANARAGIDALSADLDRVSGALGSANDGLVRFSGKMGSALDAGSASLAKVAVQTNVAVSKTASAIEAAKLALGSAAGGNAVAPDYDSIIASLREIESKTTDEAQKAKIESAIKALEAAKGATADWTKIAAALDATAQNASGSADAVQNIVQQSLSAVDAYRSAFSNDVMPSVSNGISAISAASGGFGAAVAGEKAIVDQASVVLDQLQTTLALSKDALAQTDSVLANLATELSAVKADMDALGSSNALSELFGDDGIDPDKIADFMMSPTQIQAEQVYAVDAYGSAMAPLFINLTLWIGVFMLMVIVRLEVDDEDIENLTITQRTFGRGLLLSIMAALQAVVCCTGCLVLGVQSANVPLFYLTAVIASLAYLGVQYMLSATLQHVGKGLCIILVFVQIPGATGLYPIEMTPDFFHAVYPWFPFTYGINAIRETICGFYGTAWLQNVAMLVVFLVGFVAAGTLARPYLANLNRMFAREIAESDIIIGESVELPARRYRMSQIIKAFANRDEYRAAIDARVSRYMALYPDLKLGALTVGLAVLLLSSTVLLMVGVDKVIVLTTWLIWFIIVVVYLIVVEYLRDYLSHLVSLESMSADDVRTALAARNRLTHVRPISTDFNRSVAPIVPAAPVAPSADDGSAEADELADDVEQEAVDERGDA